MFGMSMGEIALVLIIALLVVGPKNLPKAARSLGRAYAWARHHLAVMQREINMEIRRLDLEDVEKKAKPSTTVTNAAPLSPREQARIDAEKLSTNSNMDTTIPYDTLEDSPFVEETVVEMKTEKAKVLHDVPGLGVPRKQKKTIDPIEETDQ